jgi:hypothetical protein
MERSYQNTARSAQLQNTLHAELFHINSAKIVKIYRKPPNKIASFSIVDNQLASVLTLGQGFSFG